MNTAQQIFWYIAIAVMTYAVTIAVLNYKSFIDEDEYEKEQKK